MPFSSFAVQAAFGAADHSEEQMMIAAQQQFRTNRSKKTMQAVASSQARQRQPKWQHDRLNWDQHVTQLQHEGLFDQTCRLSLQSFNKLVGLLKEEIAVDFMQSIRSTGGNDPMYPELVVAASLMAYGTNTKEIIIQNVIGCSRPPKRVWIRARQLKQNNFRGQMQAYLNLGMFGCTHPNRGRFREKWP